MAYISLGYRCNHECIICPNKKTDIHGETPKEQIFKMLDNLKSGGGRSVTISGGEPTLHEAFLDTVRYAAKLGINTNVLSNGDALSDMNLVCEIEKSVDKNMFSITTAFHSHNPQIHNSVCGRDGAFDRSMQGIQNAISRGLNVQIKHCIHKKNYLQTKEFAEFVYANFPDRLPVILCGIDFAGLDDGDISEVAIPFVELGRALENALDKVIEYHMQNRHRDVFVTETPLCIADPYYWSFFEPKPDLQIKYLAPEKQETYIQSDCGTYYKACEKCGMKDICQGAWRSTVDYLTEYDLAPIKVSERS